MKIVSYNINGVRASCKAGIKDWLCKFDADVYCFQEVRCDEKLARQTLFGEDQLSLFDNNDDKPLQNYHPYFNCGNKPGYAGTLTLCKRKPDNVIFGMPNYFIDEEGRVITTIFDNMAVVNAYIPNGNTRLDFKMIFLSALTQFIADLKRKYEIILVGDFNIAHSEIDLTNPKECKNKSVFLPIERSAFSKILNLGLIDSFRYLSPNLVKYSWRSYRSIYDTNYNSWKYRIDYILVSESLKVCLQEADILDLKYSDHLPVVSILQI